MIVLPHFSQRLDARNLLWSDVLTIVEDPDSVREGGLEEFGREKWVVKGQGADGLPLEFICVLDWDDHGNIVVFVTIY